MKALFPFFRTGVRRRPWLCLLIALTTLGLLVAPTGAAHAQKSSGKGKDTSGGGGNKRKLPSEKDAQELVRATLLDVDKGLEAKDFTQLYDHLAPTWRKQITKDQLMLLFAKQLDEGQRTDYAARADAVFDPAPAFDSRGLLVLSGHLPSEPEWVLFRIKYYYENGGYRPFGIAVRVQNSNQAPSRLPNPGEPEPPPGKAAAAGAASPGAASSPPPAASASPAGSTYVSPFERGAAASPAATTTASPTPSPAATPSPR